MKKLAIVIFMGLALYACKGKVEINTTNQNEVIIKKYFEYFNAHNWVAMSNMYSDTADFKDPTLGKEIVKQTKQQTATKYKELAGIFPDIKD
jgi:hypothetical protein